jgi:hypothetical protein
LTTRAAWAAVVGVAAIACGRDAGRAAPSAVDAGPARAADAGPPAPEIVVIEHTLIEEAFWPPEAGPRPDRSKVLARAQDRLVLSGLFAVDPPTERARVRRARVRAAYAVELLPRTAEREAQLRATASVAVEWRGSGDDLDVAEVALCTAERPPDADLPDKARALLDCALDAGFAGVVDKERVRRGDEKAIFAALEDPDPSMRSAAFAAIGEHKVAAAVPRLLELLSAKDPYLRDGAIGALVALREPRAVKPLTELARFDDVDMMRRIIDAVGAIGGDDARAYLELIAGGHDVPAIRDLARSALRRLDRRGPP